LGIFGVYIYIGDVIEEKVTKRLINELKFC
jgi:hypothetical protein